MALVPCKECKAHIFVGADKCPQCGVNNPAVSYEEEQSVREKQREIDLQVAEILRLGAQKRDAYARFDELEAQLFPDGSLIPLLRALFPNAARKESLAKRDETVREIYRLRGRMDQLLDALPSERRSEVYHLWSFENTTSLSQQRKANRRQ